MKVFDATSHTLPFFKVQRYHQDEYQFNIQEIFSLKKYSRNNLATTKNEEYIINLDEYEIVGTHGFVIPVKKMK